MRTGFGFNDRIDTYSSSSRYEFIKGKLMLGSSLSSLIKLLILCLFCTACHYRSSLLTQSQEPMDSRFSSDPPNESKSQLLKQSGEAVLGNPMPFFSGWMLSETIDKPFRLGDLLSNNKSRYVLSICASWCKPCLDGLKRLSQSKDLFLDRKISLIIMVADEREHALELRERFNLTWAQIFVDEFQSSAQKFAPISASSAGQGRSLNLPRTIVFNSKGTVELIIGKEGNDFVSLLTKATPQDE